MAACSPGHGPGDLGAPPAPTTLAAGSPAPPARGPERAAPRWVRVTSLSGRGAQRSPSFDIAPDVLQWRVTAICQSGHVRVELEGEAEPLVDQECPGRFFGFSIRTGARALDIRVAGTWEVVVDQQTEAPLAEPPLPGMGGASPLASGTFSGIEQDGAGQAALYRLPGGGRALRLDPFFVTANTDLFVWASEAEAPRTSAEALEAPHVPLEVLKATVGAQNYLLPGWLNPERIRSIVIWCEPVRTAYAAAHLVRP